LLWPWNLCLFTWVFSECWSCYGQQLVVEVLYVCTAEWIRPSRIHLAFRAFMVRHRRWFDSVKYQNFPVVKRVVSVIIWSKNFLWTKIHLTIRQWDYCSQWCFLFKSAFHWIETLWCGRGYCSKQMNRSLNDKGRGLALVPFWKRSIALFNIASPLLNMNPSMKWKGQGQRWNTLIITARFVMWRVWERLDGRGGHYVGLRTL